MTLTEFLLARIAEDEAEARRGFPHPDRWAHIGTPGIGYGLPLGLTCPAVLAECEAKRRIVKWFEVTEDPSLDSMPWQIMKKVLACMTLPYADHPGYRQEWAV